MLIQAFDSYMHVQGDAGQISKSRSTNRTIFKVWPVHSTVYEIKYCKNVLNQSKLFSVVKDVQKQSTDWGTKQASASVRYQ